VYASAYDIHIDSKIHHQYRGHVRIPAESLNAQTPYPQESECCHYRDISASDVKYPRITQTTQETVRYVRNRTTYVKAAKLLKSFSMQVPSTLIPSVATIPLFASN
jgi:hypothetical protein